MSSQSDKPGNEKKNAKTILILAVVGIIAGIAISPIRKSQAQRKADAFAQEHPVTISFTVSEEIGDSKIFASELVRLARWEENTKDQIDRIYYDYRGWDLDKLTDMSQVSGYQKTKGLEEAALAVKRNQLHTELKKETLAGIENVYQNVGEQLPEHPKQDKVKAYYQLGKFGSLCNIMFLAEDGYAVEAFADQMPGWDYSASEYYESRRGDSWIIPDLLYLLWPDEIRQGYESKLQEAIGGASQNDLAESIQSLDRAVSDAQGLQERYGCTVSDLEAGEKLLDDLRAKRREEAAAAEEERKKRIQEELDKIYSSQSGYYSDPIDPDMHDIEGYYEDYRDEYDDEDDAWEGFLDDEDLWDDY